MYKKFFLQTTKFTGKVFLFTALSCSFSLPALAQVELTDEITKEAQDACINTANEKGFTLDNVVTVEPDSAEPDRLKIVLDLDRDGQEFKLTCYYGTDKSAVFADDEPPAEVDQTPVTNPAPVETNRAFPWWWLLVPIIGIPLLWFLLKGNNNSATTRNTTTDYRESVVKTTPTRTVTDVENTLVTRAWIRNNGDGVNVYSGPGLQYEVNSRISDNQEVLLTGRTENDWIELESGGWVERRYFDADSNYV